VALETLLLLFFLRSLNGFNGHEKRDSAIILYPGPESKKHKVAPARVYAIVSVDLKMLKRIAKSSLLARMPWHGGATANVAIQAEQSWICRVCQMSGRETKQA
jgi:hypothetical protein